MPWQDRSKMSLKLEFVQLADEADVNVSALCRRFDISRKTGYKWLRRYREGLKERSRRPNRSPNQLWQMDFKGHFPLVGEGRCHALTIVDDHSRFPRSLKEELLQYGSYQALPECQADFDQWRSTYNLKRPHEALDLQVPSSRYQPGSRLTPTKPPLSGRWNGTA